MKPRCARAFLLTMLLTGLALALAPQPAMARILVIVRYAKPAATGTGDCSSWDNACTLQSALLQSAPTFSSLGQIWVMQGTHKPTTDPSDTNRFATFQLKSDVRVYGGFAGNENSVEQRNVAANPTILSGAIGTTGESDNSYHVVTSTGTDSTAVLDGFTIRDGNANDPGNSFGGGMWNSGSPTLMNLTFTSNRAERGAGLYNEGGDPILENVTFSDNWASSRGGGMYNSMGNPTLTNVTFTSNSAGVGGGMTNEGNLEIPVASSSRLTNVTFTSNSGGEGAGAMENSGLQPAVRNSIFWGNTPAAGQVTSSGELNLVISDSVVQGGCPSNSLCTHPITSDPLLGTLGNYGGGTQTIPLLPGSPAIDVGSDTNCPPTDQRGVTRPQGAHCDIGAYESRGHTLAKTGGDNQTAAVNTSFALPLQTTLSEMGGSVLAGAVITYTAPSSGASATWNAGTTITRTTDSSGIASAPAPTANGTVGTFAVTASAPGAAAADFSLTNQAATSTALTSSVNPSTLGQTVVLTAAVSGAVSTGSVTFKDGAANIAGCTAVALSGGKATCSVASLSPGSHAITAVYSGDTNFAGSTSNALAQVVHASETRVYLPLLLR